MAIEIIVPRLGWTMEEGTFGRWLKQDGDAVEEGDALFELESDKAVNEVESFDHGILRILPDAPQAGDPVIVGQRLGYIVEEGEPLPEPAPPAASMPDQKTPAPVSVPAPVPAAADEPAAADREPPRTKDGPASGSISPRAARLAMELGVDWTKVRGTGRNGRIREQDIRAAATKDRMPDQTQ